LGIAGFSLALIFYGFHNRIEIELIAEVDKFLSEARYVKACRNIDEHLHREHGRSCMRRWVAARRNFADFDLPVREKASQVVNDAWLIDADDVNRIRQ
jgi:hypothetical protein